MNLVASCARLYWARDGLNNPKPIEVAGRKLSNDAISYANARDCGVLPPISTVFRLRWELALFAGALMPRRPSIYCAPCIN